jgi:hypothetical protein
MRVPPFDEAELEVVGEMPPNPLTPATQEFRYPVTPREAYEATLRHRPIWQLINTEDRIFTPRIIPDNVARGLVSEARPFDPEREAGGNDMFGVAWEYVPLVGGSMVRPGAPLLEDANEWREKLIWPDIDSWDWETSAEENNENYLTPERYNKVWFQNGWFERLISFMDFEGASVALIDEDQQDAVAELMLALSDLYIRVFDAYLRYFKNIGGFYIHDDWGSQQNSFFSPAIAQRLIVPAMRRVTDHLHARGMIAELHSCGRNMVQVENYIAAGWDSWTPQAINDTRAIYHAYGDRIIIGVAGDDYGPDATDEQQRAAARAYAEEFCHPDKPSIFNIETGHLLKPAYRKELYRRSRVRYAGADSEAHGTCEGQDMREGHEADGAREGHEAYEPRDEVASTPL